MKKAIKIWINRAEGRTDECFAVEVTNEGVTKDGKPYWLSNFFGQAREDIWTRANSVLAGWSHTAPKSGGYDKCDFKVTYEDGETYEGRYDLTHMSRDGYPHLDRHMLDFLGCISGRKKPGHISDENYTRLLKGYEERGLVKSAGEFLDTYEIGGAA